MPHKPAMRCGFCIATPFDSFLLSWTLTKGPITPRMITITKDLIRFIWECGSPHNNYNNNYSDEQYNFQYQLVWKPMWLLLHLVVIALAVNSRLKVRGFQSFQVPSKRISINGLFWGNFYMTHFITLIGCGMYVLGSSAKVIFCGWCCIYWEILGFLEAG